MNREQIYSAVWAQLSALPGFNTKSRRLKHWADVPAENQPALFMAQGNETVQTQTGLPPKSMLRVDLYVYAQCADDQAPGPVINPLVDSILNLLHAQNPVTGRSIISAPGLQYVRSEGEIQTDEGTLGNQAVAIIPITLFATDEP